MSTSLDDHLRQRRADGAACLEHALRYLRELNWSVLSVCPPDHMGVGAGHLKHCTSKGKAPWGPWKEFQDRLPTTDEIVKKWRDNPTLNVGVALGPMSGIIRIDIDGPGGEERLRQLSRGILPITWEFTSGRNNGGRGLLYTIPSGASLRTTIEKPGEPKQELRFQARGAQTVLPPSRHPEGCLYSWVQGRSPFEIAGAVAPAWLVHQLQVERPGRSQARGACAPGGTIAEGSRDTVLTSLAGSMRYRGFCEKAIFAALLIENKLRCKPPLDKGQVRKIAASVARYAAGTILRPWKRPIDVSTDLEV